MNPLDTKEPFEFEGFKKERQNPLKLIKKFWPDADIKHIRYDPEMKRGEYNIIRQWAHDGTIAFTSEMLQTGLIDIVNRYSYLK